MNILNQSKAEWFRNSKPRFEKDFNMILEKIIVDIIFWNIWNQSTK